MSAVLASDSPESVTSRGARYAGDPTSHGRGPLVTDPIGEIAALRLVPGSIAQPLSVAPFPIISRSFHERKRVCHPIFSFLRGSQKWLLLLRPSCSSGRLRTLELRIPPSVSMQPLCRDEFVRRQIGNFHIFFTMRKKIFHGGLLRSLEISPSLTMSNFALRETGRDKMNSTERLTCGSIIAGFPPLRQPQPEIADRDAVRLGSGCITAAFPPRR